MNAIVATFVFSVYLTGSVGQGIARGASPASWLGRTLTIAGLVVAVLAPVTGVLVQAPHRRRTALTVLTALAALSTSAICFHPRRCRHLAAGLALLALTAACGDLASVPYNAMLQAAHHPAEFRQGVRTWLGRRLFRQCGAAARPVLGFIVGDGLPVACWGFGGRRSKHPDSVLMTAAWFVVFAMPLLLATHLPSGGTRPARRVCVCLPATLA